MNKEIIQKLALESGFKLKPQPNGVMDLNPYVYEFVNSILNYQAKNSWIHINEQLPNDNELVLVCLNDEPKLCFYAVETNGEQRCHWWTDEYGDFISEINDGKITRWQHLPELPNH